MAAIFQTELWAMKVPNNWAVDDSEEEVAFAPQETQDAALFVSAFLKSSSITMEEMREAIENPAHEKVPATQVTLGDYKGYYKSFTRKEDDGQFAWRVWCLCCRNVHLYVTYNCALSRKGKDDPALDDMLRTVMCLIEPA